MRYEWLLFDADGTVFDFEAAEAHALSETLADHGFPSGGDATVAYRRINAETWQALERGEVVADDLNRVRFTRFFSAVDVDGADPESFGAAYLRHLAAGTQLIDGAREVVERLHGRHRLALVTNGLADVQRPRLVASGMGRWFDPVVISEEIGVAKPDEAYFEVAFERMGHPPRDSVLIIGDSLTSDIAGGNRFGIDTCWFNPHGRDPEGVVPTHEIGSLESLLDIV